MAKVTTTRRPPRPVPQAGYSPGYTWMLLFTVFAMAGGIALLYIELSSDYGGLDSDPKGMQTVPPLKALKARPVTFAPLPPNNRAALDPVDPPAEPIAVAAAPAEPEPRLRPAGPFIVRIPPPFPMPGIHTR